MKTLRAFWIRLCGLLGRSRTEDDFQSELESHIAMDTEEGMRAGLSREEARRQALIRLGGVEQARQAYRERATLPWIESLLRDVRYALRQLRKSPGFAITAILTISLGIGLNTAMFSVIRAVLLKSLDYNDPDRLVLPSSSITPIHFEEMRASARSYEGLGAYSGKEDLALSGDGQPEVLKGARVSGNFLDILGVKPLLGRSFLPSEDTPGGPAVAMISAELWQRRFNRNPSIIGRSVTLAGAAYTIIGVLPPKFHFPSTVMDVWLTRPSEWSVLNPQSRHISPILQVFGRLKRGVDISQANAELALIDRQYEAAHPGMLDTDKSIARLWNRPPIHLVFLKNHLVSDIRSKLWLLFGAVGLVLFIVCANIASLLLARATARSREFAVRAAIGAGRWRIIGQLLTESILLSFMGGAFGIAIAALAVKIVRRMTELDIPRSGEITIDSTVLLFAAVLSFLTGLLFGLTPALSASQSDLAGVLRGSGEGANHSRQKSRFARVNLRSMFVIGQVALSTVLLIGATLLIESLARVYRVDPGFKASNLLTMSLTPSSTRYGTEQKRTAFYNTLIEHIDAIPGVTSAAITTALPMTPYPMAQVQVASRSEDKRPLAMVLNITPQYFQTMKIPLKRGRGFNAQDDARAIPVAVINESLARHFWPQSTGGAQAIGQHILIGSHTTPIEVVGIVADTREYKLTEGPSPGVYLSSMQHPPKSAMLVIRTEGHPLSFGNTVRNAISGLDHDQPIAEVASMNTVVDASEGQLRMMMTLLGAFAVAATIITVVGLYGVIAYSVVQRTKEIGIRMALGAQHGNIRAFIFGHGLRLVLGGLLLGISGALALTRVLQGLLFQISASDPTTYIGIAFLFVTVSFAACYFPARRAASIDPMRALRAE